MAVGTTSREDQVMAPMGREGEREAEWQLQAQVAATQKEVVGMEEDPGTQEWV